MAQIIIVDYVKNDASVYRVHMKNEYGDIVQKSKVLADFDKTLAACLTHASRTAARASAWRRVADG